MRLHDHVKVRHNFVRFIQHVFGLTRNHLIDGFEIKYCQKSPILQLELVTPEPSEKTLKKFRLRLLFHKNRIQTFHIRTQKYS